VSSNSIRRGLPGLAQTLKPLRSDATKVQVHGRVGAGRVVKDVREQAGRAGARRRGRWYSKTVSAEARPLRRADVHVLARAEDAGRAGGQGTSGAVQGTGRARAPRTGCSAGHWHRKCCRHQVFGAREGAGRVFLLCPAPASVDMAMTTTQVALLRTVGAAVSIYFNAKYLWGAGVPDGYRRLFIVVVLLAAIIGIRNAK
jgi:hypothetical protein